MSAVYLLWVLQLNLELSQSDPLGNAEVIRQLFLRAA